MTARPSPRQFLGLLLSPARSQTRGRKCWAPRHKRGNAGSPGASGETRAPRRERGDAGRPEPDHSPAPRAQAVAGHPRPGASPGPPGLTRPPGAGAVSFQRPAGHSRSQGLFCLPQAQNRKRLKESTFASPSFTHCYCARTGPHLLQSSLPHDRQTHGDTGRDTHRHTHVDTQTHTDTHRDTDTDRDTDTQRHGQRHTHRHVQRHAWRDRHAQRHAGTQTHTQRHAAAAVAGREGCVPTALCYLNLRF